MNKLIVVAALGLAGTMASARPLYEKALLLNGDDGPYAYSGQQIADDFMLSSDASVSQATWYGNFLGLGDSFDTGATFTFALRFYADTGGGPAASAFNAQEVVATLTDPGINQGGDAIYHFSANLSPVGLLGGVKYYLNVEEIDPSTPKPSFRWNNGAVDGDDDVMFFNSGSGWNASGDPRSGNAFSLGVPAPCTALVGMGGVFMNSRRRR